MLESPDGTLTDKHVDAASQLLRSQYPHLQGSLISQSRYGFNPFEVSNDNVPKVMLNICIDIATNRQFLMPFAQLRR